MSDIDAKQPSSPGDRAGAVDGPTGGGAEERSPLEPLLANLAEIQEYLSLYLSARADLIKVSARRIVILAAVGIAGGALLLTILIVSAVLLLNGCAEAIGTMAGGRLWIGQLAIGGGVILGTCVTAAVTVQIWFRTSRRATKRKYEHRHQVQQAKFGHRATESAQQ